MAAILAHVPAKWVPVRGSEHAPLIIAASPGAIARYMICHDPSSPWPAKAGHPVNTALTYLFGPWLLDRPLSRAMTRRWNLLNLL